MCLYPIASLIDVNPDSLTLLFSPFTMEDTTDGPLKTKAEYSCRSEAPEIIASHAASFESIPPTPMMGVLPPVSSYTRLMTSNALEFNGLPESPPSFENAFLACVVKGTGRYMVVFVATIPSIPIPVERLTDSEI